MEAACLKCGQVLEPLELAGPIGYISGDRARTQGGYEGEHTMRQRQRAPRPGTHRTSRRPLLGLALSSLLLASCAAEFSQVSMDGDFEGLDAELDHEAEDEGDAAGADGAYTLVELEEDPCYEAVEISELRDTLIFSVSCEPESVDVEVGDVLVGVSDGGYLGQIVSLEFGDETLTVHIEPVALAEVIGDGSFSTEVELNHRAIVDVSGKVLYQENFGGMLVECRGQLEM